MLEEVRQGAELALGVGKEPIAWWQMLLRIALVYASGVLLVRLGKRRFMGQYTAHDMILGVTVGALLANAAGDPDAFVNAVVIVFGLGALHSLVTVITYRWKPVEDLIKGKAYDLIQDGEPLRDGVRKSRLSRADLHQALRKAGLKDAGQIERATFERSGEISIITASSENGEEKEDKSASDGEDRGGDGAVAGVAVPHVVEVAVAEGVQRVVVEWRPPT